MKKNKKKNYNKIGILGGSFDPPHQGHLYISKIALKKLKLNKVIWVITKKNPLKQKPFLEKNIRMKLSKKIVKNSRKIYVKYFEDKVKSNSTFSLLKYITRKNRNVELFFLIGADNLKKFHKWKNWKKIPNLAKIVVFPRKNCSFNSFATKTLCKNDLLYIKSKEINISSSIIRKYW